MTRLPMTATKYRTSVLYDQRLENGHARARLPRKAPRSGTRSNGPTRRTASKGMKDRADQQANGKRRARGVQAQARFHAHARARAASRAVRDAPELRHPETPRHPAALR